MKKLFAALMFLFITSFVFGSTPIEYDIGKKEVKVFVKSIDHKTTVAVASVDLKSMEVQKLSSVATVKVVQFKNQIDVFGISTTYNYCEYLYIAQRPKFVIHYDKIPIQNKNVLCYTDANNTRLTKINLYFRNNKHLFSAGGMPSIQC